LATKARGVRDLSTYQATFVRSNCLIKLNTESSVHLHVALKNIQQKHTRVVFNIKNYVALKLLSSPMLSFDELIKPIMAA